MKYLISFLTLFLVSYSQATTEKKITKKEYVETWSRVAMENMISHKIPASITLAQGILESGSGNSDLARLANNHFGIKCHDWKGETIYKDDDKKNECFRKYKNAEQSYFDHSEFLTKRQRYANLFALEITDYKGWAKGLKVAGYATNPKYPYLLINIIEDLNLFQFDELVLNRPKNQQNALAKNDNSKPVTKDNSSKKTEEKVQQDKKTPNKQETVKKQEVEVNLGKTRSTSTHENKVKYVIAKKGDTYYKIAEEFGMTLGQIHKYNDVKYGNKELKEGAIVNIHPKKTKGAIEYKTYKKDMTILEISQIEGIKVKSLIKMNQLNTPNDVIKKGSKIKLK